MNRIKIRTKQSKEVLEILKRNEIYYASLTHTGFKKEYSELMKITNTDKVPIFACPVNQSIGSNDFGFQKDDVTIYLNVPKSECLYMEYYTWTDFMFFYQENDYGKKQSFDEDNAREWLIKDLAKKKSTKDYDTLQITIDKIDPKWIYKIEEREIDY